MSLSNLSRTAILTLICRIVATEKDNANFNDPMAAMCLDRLMSIVSEEDRRWISRERRIYSGTQAHHAIAGAQRVKVYDEIADRYILDNPNCTVINLACGFDTRFWRIAHENCRYVEVDLPEVVTLKREILKDQPGYVLIGCSVLEAAWVDQVTAHGSSHFLLLAEGLLPWLPEPDVIRLFQMLSQRFACSQLVVDAVPAKYLKPFWKKLISLETRYMMGIDIYWDFGIQQPRQLEAYAPGIKVLGHVKSSAGPIITVSIHAE